MPNSICIAVPSYTNIHKPLAVLLLLFRLGQQMRIVLILSDPIDTRCITHFVSDHCTSQSLVHIRQLMAVLAKI